MSAALSPPPGKAAPSALTFGVKAAAALILATVLAVFLLPRTPGRDEPPRSAVAQERLLRFADRDDGAVLVTDATSGRQIATVTGEQGFFRGVISGLTRIRGVEGVGQVPPFRLRRYADGRLVLDDPATGKRIELEAFGSTNQLIFAGLLP